MTFMKNSVSEKVFEMAKTHGVEYKKTRLDAWANDVTRLSGDDVELDEVELLLLALCRAGHLSGREMLEFQNEYKNEGEVDVRPVR